MHRVDAHHHVWSLANRDQPWIDPVRMAAIRRDFSLDELRPQAAAAGVGRTVVVQTVPSIVETRELLDLAARPNPVSAVVGWTDLAAGSVLDDLAALRESPGGRLLKGVRHQVQDEADPRWLVRPDVLRGLRAVADAELCYELLVVPAQLDAALETVRALGDLTFVLDHIAKPPIASGEFEPWEAGIRALAREPHVYCKLSGMVTEADWSRWTAESIRRYSDIVFDAFGPERVMFGSDWPVCLLAADYAGVVDLAETLTERLTAEERNTVFGATAQRVYRLG